MERWTKLMLSVEARHGVVTHDDLVATGLTPRQVVHLVGSGRLVRRGRGVYRVAGAPSSFESEVAAALRDLGRDGFVWASHHTAARLWEIPLFGRAELEVTRPLGLSAARSGVLVHRSTSLPDHHVTTLRGMPVTTPSRTLFDLARVVGPVRLDRAVSHAVHSDDVPCSIASLYRVLYDLGGRGRPGTRRMRSVLDHREVDEPATESVLDELGRALLRDIPGIEWQVVLSDERGYIRRVDALVRHAHLVVELDGRLHDDPAQTALDVEGDARLAGLDLMTKRYRWADITRHGDRTRAEVLHLATRAVS